MCYSFIIMIQKTTLTDLYLRQRLSSSQISARLGCSINKVNYWLIKHGIPKRTISDAIYIKLNPDGDPFTPPKIDTLEKSMLYGIGLGLYWGEGTKANKYAVRLGNSDPELLMMFIRFLTELYGVNKADMRFGLQIFSDIDPAVCLEYWVTKLGLAESQFYKLHITPSGSLGTYRHKSRYGVVTIYYHNKRLRDIIVNALPGQIKPDKPR